MTVAFVIGAPRSGAGKTSVTIGLLRALARRGLAVAAVKSGPDYIDPGFHRAATGRPGVNCDTWAMPPALVGALMGRAAAGADVVIVESAMGLFDGVEAGAGRTGAAADLARRFGLPVVLVLDVSGQSRTAAAVACGFRHYDPAVPLSGVILNKVGSERHRTQAADAVTDAGIAVFGSVPRDPTMALPERHLGLVQADEHSDIAAVIDRLADTMDAAIDIDALLAAAGTVAPPAPEPAAALRPPGQRIALAHDAAFTFVYPHVVDGWRSAGAEIVPFSPLADAPPPDDCDACWLPGGYPELHAGALAAADRFRAGLAAFAATRPVHGECGGYMALGAALTDAGGATHRMAGLLGHTTSFAVRKMALGYRVARLCADGPLGPAGLVVRGHEFHYARVIEPGSDAPFADGTDALGRHVGLLGGRRGLVSGTFFHAIAEDA